METNLIKDTLLEAETQFRYYAECHRAKDTADASAKATVNLEYAERCHAALAHMESNLDLTTVETVADYRFKTMTKSDGYAFARGLTIAPTHLPAALDAMREDGYNLLAIFGNPTAADIGFIFTRTAASTIEGDGESIFELHNERNKLAKRVDGLLEANNELVEKNRALKAAMRTFVTRVDAGEIRSVRTYKQFRELLDGD